MKRGTDARGRTLGATVSLTVHAAAIAWLLAATAHAPAAPPPPEEQKKEAKQAQAEDQHPHFRGEEKVSTGLVCGGTEYVGIGIKHSFDGRLIDIAPGSPAARAGLRIGDVLVNIDSLQRDGYPVGTEITLIVTRAGRPLEVPVTVAKICEE